MKISQAQLTDFIILSLRWYLAFYMFSYGIAKIEGNQFGVANPDIINRPLKDVDTFYITWYLFSRSHLFNVIIGATQIIGAVLIIYNRTALLGALFLLPVLIQIEIVDAAFTYSMFGYALILRLAAMIFADLAIMFYYKTRLKEAFADIIQGDLLRFKYRWWVYLFLPLIGFITDFILRIFTLPFQLLIQHFSR